MADVLMEGKKNDSEKTQRPELIPPEAIEALGTVLAFGAKKYTSTQWGKFWDVVNATRLDLYIAGACVGRVMKNDLGQPILSLPNVNDKTTGLGKPETLNVFKTWTDAERAIQTLWQEIPKLNESLGSSGSTTSLQNKQTSSWQEAVKFAEASNTFTLITTTKQGSSEEYCVVSTTMASASLETTLKVLKPHLDTSVLKVQTGDRNWELGMSWSRVFGAAMRHLWAWWKKEDKDPETGYSHLWHAFTCIAFLIAYEQRNAGKDDRP